MTINSNDDYTPLTSRIQVEALVRRDPNDPRVVILFNEVRRRVLVDDLKAENALEQILSERRMTYIRAARKATYTSRLRNFRFNSDFSTTAYSVMTLAFGFAGGTFFFGGIVWAMVADMSYWTVVKLLLRM